MERLKDLSEQFEISLDDNQIDCFEKYFEMLVEKNKVMNLTAITQKDDVILKHFLDSIAIGAIMSDISNDKNSLNIIDVGTGAGFPGIPIKIAFPEHNVTLLDSLNKRVKFLQEVIDANGLTNITAVHSRAEDGARNKEYRDHFDLSVSRAVANLSTLSEYCLPYVKVGGYFVSYKSGNVDEELEQAKKAIKLLGGKVEKVVSFDLPADLQDKNVSEGNVELISRTFVIIKKIKETPKAYPRKAGTASKSPIA